LNASFTAQPKAPGSTNSRRLRLGGKQKPAEMRLDQLSASASGSGDGC